jgi:hypothetical protein
VSVLAACSHLSPSHCIAKCRKSQTHVILISSAGNLDNHADRFEQAASPT